MKTQIPSPFKWITPVILACLSWGQAVAYVSPQSLPYSEFFDSDSNFNLYYTQFNPSDGPEWFYATSEKALGHSAYLAADAWVATPPLFMSKGVEYKVSFYTRVESVGIERSLEVRAGRMADPESMTIAVWSENVTDHIFGKREAVFSVDVDGAYYIAFHTSSPQDYSRIFIDDIIVEDNTPKPSTTDPFPMPFLPDFALESTFFYWTIPTNANGQPQWLFDTYYHLLYTNTDGEAWLYTPPLALSAGELRLEFQATCYTRQYPEYLYLYLKKQPTPEFTPTVDIGEVYLDNSSSNPPAITKEFHLGRKGTYYLAFHVPDINKEVALRSLSFYQDVVTGVENPDIENLSEITCIYDIFGRKCLTVEGEWDIHSLPLPAGCYIAHTSFSSPQPPRILKFIR